ncbi:MAG: YfjI family protein [Gemmataceae bacterium]
MLAELMGAENALSLRLSIDAALAVETLAHAKRLPPDYLHSLGVADAADQAGYVIIDYRDAGGYTRAVRRRHSLATKARWKKNTHAIAYGEDHLSEAVKDGYLTVVEGESDCWTLWYHGFPALGIPGAECARVLQVSHVTPFKRLYVVQEGDAAGEKFVDGIVRRLAELRWLGQLRVITMSDKTKDPSVLYIANPEAFAQDWRQRMETAVLIERPVTTIVPASPVLLPYLPFPIDALPAPLAAFVRNGASALGCDPCYFALPILSVAASMIGNSRTIRLKRDWTEPSVIWAAVVGDSGTLKSPAQRLVVSPVYRIQKELLDIYKKEKAAYDAVKAEYEQAIKKAKKDSKPPDDVLPAPPTPGRILTGDITIEKLGQLLADNPRGMLVCRDELRSWFASFGRYKGQAGGSDLPAWLEFFRAESVIIDRKTGDRPTLLIPRAAVSVCGGIQPGTLARVLTPEAFESGLAARLLVAMPTGQRKQWSEAEIVVETQQRYETLLRKLHALKPETDEGGDPEPFVLRLTPEAKQTWIIFYGEWAAKQADAEGELAAALAKLEAYAARFALIHHIVTRVDVCADDCDPVGRASIEAGITLARWFAYEAERVYAVCKSTDAERDARRLIDYIQGRGGEITSRRLHLANKSRYPTLGAADAALEALRRAGLGDWTQTGEGGRPSRKFALKDYTTRCKSYESPDRTADAADGDTTKSLLPRDFRGENDASVAFEACSKDSERKNDPSPPSDTAKPFVASPDEADDEGEGELWL